LTAQEKHSLQTLPATSEDFMKQAGVLEGVQRLGDCSAFEANWRQPSLAINAFAASNKHEARNILVDSAWARVGVRIVPDMQAQEVSRMLQQALIQSAPWGVHVDIHEDTANDAWYTESSHPAFAAAMEALERGYGKPCVLVGCGGSIPFVDAMSKGLGGIPALLMGVEDPYTQAHGENESLSLDDFYKAIASAVVLYERLSKVLV
jgi:acetylornithine deacetylase/succinyl-diaminopimelate desuccinylase-like protein